MEPVDIPRRILSVDEAAAAVEAAVKARLVASYTALVDATDIAVDTLINIGVVRPAGRSSGDGRPRDPRPVRADP